MYAATVCGTGRVRNLSSVTTPKLPLPAPRSAQNRSGWCLASTVRVLPSAVTTVAAVRLSQVRPYARDATP